MMSEKNKKHYFDEMDRAEFSSIFSSLFNEKSPEIIIWKKGQEEVIEEFTPTSFQESENAIYANKKGSFLNKIAGSEFLDHDIFAKFVVDRYKYFFTAKLFFSSKTKEFKISIAGNFYKSQQRTNYRLDSSKDNVIQIWMNNGLHNGVDISAGGASIHISTKDQEVYPKGKTFNNCELVFNKIKYKIPAIKVMGILPFKDEGGNEGHFCKLGLSFINLSQATEEGLFRQINSQIRLLAVKKKFNLSD